MAGAILQVNGLRAQWRLGIVAACLVVFAFVDLVAIRRRIYCPLSWRRQTPQSLRFRYGVMTTAAVWGFDTGLAVTTFRVAAVTWGALLLTFFGFGSWKTGLAYALAFVIPIVLVLNGQHAERRSSKSLEALLHKRTVLQCVSFIVLFSAGVFLLIVN